MIMEILFKDDNYIIYKTERFIQRSLVEPEDNLESIVDIKDVQPIGVITTQSVIQHDLIYIHGDYVILKVGMTYPIINITKIGKINIDYTIGNIKIVNKLCEEN